MAICVQSLVGHVSKDTLVPKPSPEKEGEWWEEEEEDDDDESPKSSPESSRAPSPAVKKEKKKPKTLDDFNPVMESSEDGVGVAALIHPTMLRAFAGLCTGGVEGRGRVPDEFLGMMATGVAPLIDEAWRTQVVDQVLSVVEGWISHFCEGRVDVQFVPGRKAKKDGIKGPPPTFEMNVPGYGVIVVTVKDGEELNKMMLWMLERAGRSW